MKVLKKGRPQKGWAKEFICTGKGNGDGGCGAKLLVEQGDLYLTYRHWRDETDTYVTFTCAECGVETDIERGSYTGPWNVLPDKKVWLSRQHLVSFGEL